MQIQIRVVAGDKKKQLIAAKRAKNATGLPISILFRFEPEKLPITRCLFDEAVMDQKKNCVLHHHVSLNRSFNKRR